MTEVRSTTDLVFRFERIGFLPRNVDHAVATYQAIGCSVSERQQLSAGTDVLMRFVGAPLSRQSEEYLDRQGWSIERVSLSCDDAATAHDQLTANGVQSAWKPHRYKLDHVTVTSAGVWSPEGLMIEINSYEGRHLGEVTRADRGNLALHHVCCLTHDLAKAEAFWTSHFGLTKTYDFTAPLTLPDGNKSTKGFVMLSDPSFNDAGHEFALEIIGGEFDSIDGPVMERRGPCYDHVCFTTDDVAGVWQRAVDARVEPLSEPAYYSEYDSTIAWLYDSDGTHVELMSPVPPELMTTAAATGVCSNHWVDNWQRAPAVLPRIGDQPLTIER